MCSSPIRHGPAVDLTCPRQSLFDDCDALPQWPHPDTCRHAQRGSPWLTEHHILPAVQRSAHPYSRTSTGFDKPWRLLAEFVPDLQVHEHAFGAGYVASGHYAPATR